jgi:phosphosulfolactate phosphohydrolase-like enzyme
LPTNRSVAKSVWTRGPGVPLPTENLYPREASGLDPEAVHVGSTVNAAAVAAAVADHEETWLVAAGHQGDPVGEDSAGVDLIEGHLTGSPRDADELATAIRETDTARWLVDMGFEHEVDALCEFDSTDVVPQLGDGAFRPPD